MKFTQFNKNVIYFIAPRLGFGFVWRRHNDKKNRMGWLKIVWNEKYNEHSIKVVGFGYNPIKVIESLRKHYDPNKEWYEQ